MLHFRNQTSLAVDRSYQNSRLLSRQLLSYFLSATSLLTYAL
jgi:hypothetical protein